MPIHSSSLMSVFNYGSRKVESFIPHEIDSKLLAPEFRDGKFYFPHYPKAFYLTKVFYGHLIKEGSIDFIYSLNAITKDMSDEELLDFLVRFERQTDKERSRINNGQNNLYGLQCLFFYQTSIRKVAEIFPYFTQWIQSGYSLLSKRVDKHPSIGETEVAWNLDFTDFCEIFNLMYDADSFRSKSKIAAFRAFKNFLSIKSDEGSFRTTSDTNRLRNSPLQYLATLKSTYEAKYNGGIKINIDKK